MQACGICHSDVMIAGLEKLPLAPVTLGHEGIGIIEALGTDAGGLRVGDRVGITYFASSCGACAACRSGRERFCARQHNHGYTRHGALANYCIAATQNLVPIPESLPAAEAAPLCCAGWTAYGALREAGLPAGETVGVFGMGGLGHLAVQYARSLGLKVAVVDVAEDKLEYARSLGAAITATSADARRVLLKEHGGVDAAIVFTASPAAVPDAFSCLRRCGSLILVGLSSERCALPINEIVIKGIRVQGSYLGTRADLEAVFALAVQGVARARVEEFPLAEAPRLIERLGQGKLLGRAVVTF
jgi:alcohol dehydrogenase, propanol-preferring